MPDPDAVARLGGLLAEAGLCSEDWTASVRMICHQCSQGIPHQHESAPEFDAEQQAAWVPARRIGIAAPDEAAINVVLATWQAQGGAVGALECVLAADKFEEE